jgi:predicted Co/Zn/Cd cation transporter (cation efflux family)
VFGSNGAAPAGGNLLIPFFADYKLQIEQVRCLFSVMSVFCTGSEYGASSVLQKGGQSVRPGYAVAYALLRYGTGFQA